MTTSTTPTARAADCKREEFRKHLETEGALELITKIFGDLHDKKTHNEKVDTISYIARELGYRQVQQPTVDALMAEIEELTLERNRWKAEAESLKAAERDDKKKNGKYDGSNTKLSKKIDGSSEKA